MNDDHTKCPVFSRNNSDPRAVETEYDGLPKKLNLHMLRQHDQCQENFDTAL